MMLHRPGEEQCDQCVRASLSLLMQPLLVSVVQEASVSVYSVSPLYSRTLSVVS